ncbi:hypothetical protein Q604_UNBC04073G0001, partial [human gut metagenome]
HVVVNHAQRAVPRACEAVPIARPRAALVRIRIALSNVWPNTAPRMPTKITQTALIAGIPPILPPTAIAIGVVTDFGRIDAAISG